MIDVDYDISLSHWPVRYGDFEYSREKAHVLYRKGWVIETASDVSPFELKKIKEFLNKFEKNDVYLKIESVEDSIKALSAFYATICITVCFIKPQDREAFRFFLSSLPKRQNLYVLDNASEIIKEIQNLLKNKNYYIIKTDDRTLLSVETLSDSEKLYIKMLL